jgi:hypothetical protein
MLNHLESARFTKEVALIQRMPKKSQSNTSLANDFSNEPFLQAEFVSHKHPGG